MKIESDILTGQRSPTTKEALRIRTLTAGVGERQMQRELYFRNKANTVLPNYTPTSWNYECDLYAVRPTLWTVEYEMKSTKADYKKDFSKTSKHRRLSEQNPNDKGLPTQFYYVMPAYMVLPSEIPEYAGLIYCWWWTEYIGEALHSRVIRKAPRISENKCKKDTVRRMEKTAMWRFWIERQRFDDHVFKYKSTIEEPGVRC